MRIAVPALVGAVLVALVCLAVTPARHWTQEQAVCRNAEFVARGDRAIGAFGQDPEKVALVCAYRNRSESVGKGAAVLGGIGVSVGLGLLAGALAGGLMVLRRR